MSFELNENTLFYNIDFKHTLPYEKAIMYDLENFVDFEIASLDTNRTLKNLYGDYSIKGSIVEKINNDEIEYNTLINVYYDDILIKSLNSNNGKFVINGLNQNIEYKIDFIDVNNKYQSKTVTARPKKDYNVKGEINIIDYTKVLFGYFDMYFKIKVIGESHSVVLVGAPTNFEVENVRDDIYRVHGSYSERKLSFEIMLYDYKPNETDTISKRIDIGRLI